MSWLAPWALVGLAVLPVVWFLHRRRKRPRPVLLPSLLFLRLEPAAAPARRQVLDPELWLSVLAVLLLVGAAAGPVLTTRGAGRTARVVVSGGLSATARGYRDRVEDVLGRIRSELAPEDRLVVVEEPPATTPLATRPDPMHLLAAAQAGDAAWRVVVSDVSAPDPETAVTWISVGSAETFNVGIVAASLTPGEAGFELFVNVRGDDARPAAARLVVREAETIHREQRLDLAPGTYVSHAFAIPRIGLAFRVELTAPDGGSWADDLAADDVVEYERSPVRVHLDPALPPTLRHAVEDALVASLGRRGIQEAPRDPVLRVVSADTPDGPSSAPWTLVLHPAPPEGARRAGAGVDRVRPDALGRDLSTVGADLVYAPAAAGDPPAGFDVVLGRDADGRLWPVVVRRERVIEFRPDPTRGRPPPAETPLWPLFVDDLLGVVAGQDAGGVAGYRRRAVCDEASSTLGRTSGGWRVPDLGASPPDVAPRTRSLRPALLAAALLAFLALWVVPWSGRRARRRARRQGVPSAHGEPVTS